MPIRKFCDLCDEQISDAVPYFELEVRKMKIDPFSDYGEEDDFTDIRHDMVCPTCIGKIKTKIHDLSHNQN